MKVLDREAVLNAIPTNWLDDLLTGPHKVIADVGKVNEKDIERVLQAVRARIAALPTLEPCDVCDGLVDSTADACHHCG